MCICKGIEDRDGTSDLLALPIYLGSDKNCWEVGQTELTLDHYEKGQYGDAPEFSLNLGILIGDMIYECTKLEVHYCPVCGRKLREVNQDESSSVCGDEESVSGNGDGSEVPGD